MSVPAFVHLSLAQLFRRKWGSAYDALAAGRLNEPVLRELVNRYPLDDGAPVYALDTSVSAPGQYRVLFKQSQREEVAGFVAPDAVELHSVGTNTSLLDQMATTSGGHRLADPTDLRPGASPGPSVDLWPWLLLLGLVLLPVDVYLRRRA